MRGAELSPPAIRHRAVSRQQEVNESEPPHGTYYSDYLDLKSLLSSQKPVSPHHEELLFVIVHQSHELWFKMIIADLSRVHSIMSGDLKSPDLATAISSLERIKMIQPMLLQKLAVLETMTPMEFLEFRDLLVPASGFQSWQFRIIEIIMGLSSHGRSTMSHEYMQRKLREEDYDKVMEWENRVSVEHLTEKWLEQLPWLQKHDGPDNRIEAAAFDWMEQYKAAVYQMLDSDECNMRQVYSELNLGPDMLEEDLHQVRVNRATFDSLFDVTQHTEMKDRGFRNFSQKAILNAIFVYLYRDLTELHSPFRFLTLLVEIDDGFTSWRYRHAQMAHRMIGRKMGTGATSGADHLLRVAQQNSTFNDLRNISTFLIPKSQMPPLPDYVLASLRS
jgi:tryptophan 2,3-dioxygenase